MKFTIALLFLSAVFTAAVSDVPTDKGGIAHPYLNQLKLISSSDGGRGSLTSYGDQERRLGC